jgi:hypothetical protein
MKKLELQQRFRIVWKGTGTYEIRYTNNIGTYALIIQDSLTYDYWNENTLKDLLFWRKRVLQNGRKVI